jgi:hypothetical protein
MTERMKVSVAQSVRILPLKFLKVQNQKRLYGVEAGCRQTSQVIMWPSERENRGYTRMVVSLEAG